MRVVWLFTLFVALVFHSAFHSWSGYARLGVSYESRYGIFDGEGNVFVHKLVGPGCLKLESG